MNTKNKLIVLLLIIGIAIYGAIHGIILPKITQSKQQYALAQQNPLTHDIESVLKYKNQYMGNASNFSILFNSLPLSTIKKQFQLYPDKHTADIVYKADALTIGTLKLDQALIYNAAAAFALIDNLKETDFKFRDAAFKVSRSDVEKWYGMNASSLLKAKNWEKEVQRKLHNDQYVRRCAASIIQRF